MNAMTATPPTAPPTIAPMGVFFLGGSGGGTVVVGPGGSVVVVVVRGSVDVSVSEIGVVTVSPRTEVMNPGSSWPS